MVYSTHAFIYVAMFITIFFLFQNICIEEIGHLLIIIWLIKLSDINEFPYSISK